jgi:hypothetical protein
MEKDAQLFLLRDDDSFSSVVKAVEEYRLFELASMAPTCHRASVDFHDQYMTHLCLLLVEASTLEEKLDVLNELYIAIKSDVRCLVPMLTSAWKMNGVWHLAEVFFDEERVQASVLFFVHALLASKATHHIPWMQDARQACRRAFHNFATYRVLAMCLLINSILVKDAMVVELDFISRRMVSLLPALDIQCCFLDFLLVLLSEKSSTALLCDYKQFVEPAKCIADMHRTCAGIQLRVLSVFLALVHQVREMTDQCGLLPTVIAYTIEEMRIASETHPHDKQVCLAIQRASEVVRQQQRGQSFAFLQVLAMQPVVCVPTSRDV